MEFKGAATALRSVSVNPIWIKALGTSSKHLKARLGR